MSIPEAEAPPVRINGQPPRRMMFVHAHPDDETTTTGATIARYAAQGVGITLVTCTLGERGEIVDQTASPAGAVREADSASADEQARRLGERRHGELLAACGALGLTDVRLLGGPGTWWDSGMANARTHHPRAFADGDLDTQVSQLVAIIREVCPQVVVTYDERGGYGHPDHVRAHEVTVAATQAAQNPHRLPRLGAPWQVAKLYAAVVPHSQLRQAVRILASATVAGANPFAALRSQPAGSAAGGDPDAELGSRLDALPFGVPDEAVTARIDAREWIAAKTAAMRAHRSQMSTNGWFFALADDPEREFAIEHYRLLRGPTGPTGPAVNRPEPETDLFAGVAATMSLSATPLASGDPA